MITIRSWEPRDTGGVVDLIVGIQRQEFGVSITAADQPDLADVPSFYQQGKGNFWVATSGTAIVGTISLKDIGNNQVALRKMFVAPSFRGAAHGVAARLLDTALAWAQSHGVTDIFLGTTDKFIAAHRFYEKQGFELIDQSSLPASFPVMGVDSRFYRRHLSPPDRG